MGKLMGHLQKMIDATGRRDKQTFLDGFTDDVEYVMHVKARPLLGKAWVEKFLDRHWETATDFVWQVDRFAENGDILMVEGREDYVIKDTGEKVSHPYMGVYEFRGDKIAKMRDYFEMADPRALKK